MGKKYKVLWVKEDVHTRLKTTASTKGLSIMDYLDKLSGGKKKDDKFRLF